MKEPEPAPEIAVPTAMSGAGSLVLDRIDRQGPLPLSQVLDLALYHPAAGFYETGGVAGRRDGDFLTSPEVGPLFGEVVARALDAWWRELGEPDPYVVVEAGAGPGSLARTVRAAAPSCARALRYVLVDRAAAQRHRHGDRLPLEHPSLVLPPIDADTERPVPEAPPGPLFTSLAELPRLPEGIPAVVLANELLDNLPFDLAERHERGWAEVRVGRAPTESERPTETRAPQGPRPATAWEVTEGRGRNVSAAASSRVPRLEEVLVPLDEARTAVLDRLAPEAPPGVRVPLQAAAASWLQEALSTAGRRGRVVVIDYAAATAELVGRPWTEWLRTYRHHGPGRSYLDALGQQDVTSEVAVDQLALVRRPTADEPQADWLRRYGIEELVAEGRRTWNERAHIGDLTALAARSRVSEAEALLDPKGLGTFRVISW